MALRDTIRIMIVDDMSTSRGILMNSLYEIGIKQVSYATDGQEALDKIMGNPVHMILCDYEMPGMDGLGLLKNLREARATQRIGFILVTGKATQEMVNMGQQLGMNNMIKKPFTTAAMKQCIERVVGRL